MTVNEQLFVFIATALSIVTIIAGGTLIAADIIHLGRRPEPLPDEKRGPTVDSTSNPQDATSDPAAIGSREHATTS